MSDMPTVFVVDDDQAVRRSLEALLQSVSLRVEVFASAQQFLDAHDPNRPGCLVLDIRMPGMSGSELQRHLRQKGVSLPVIIITGHGDVPIAVRAMKDGALEFLEKPFSKQLLLEHVHMGLRRDRELRERAARRADALSRLSRLTERERQVMEHVIRGNSSKAAASGLGISKKTIDVHRARIMQKLQVESIPALIEIVHAADDSGLAS